MALEDPEVRLATLYAPERHRGAIVALFSLDAALARIVATTSDPTIGQIRMTWWHDALSRLDIAPPPAEPVLSALAIAVVANGVPGSALARIVEGWEELLASEPALDRYAVGRGGGLFTAVGGVLGASEDPVERAGQGWALVDLARKGGPRAALEAASAPLAATSVRWSMAGRPLGMLARLARRDVARRVERQGSPARLLAMAAHRLTGR